MNWLQSIRKRTFEWEFRKLDANGKGKHDFTNLDMAKNIAIILNTTEPNRKEWDELIAYISNWRDLQKKITLIEINYRPKSVPSLLVAYMDAFFINKESMNWSEKPKGEVVDKLYERKFDVLIDLDLTSGRAAKLLCKMVRATTRVGFFEEGFESCYELMIVRPVQVSLLQSFKAMEQYLTMIQPATSR